ncbi:hypothetical protein MTsPCn9_19190 [Croceitalea sp. MTPC9]|uniref:hypothetical protein n=1 Tax=unclassified Croceitalea TaxID=2632280 RepID=UPI002B3C10CF|nr:hypothetical protein MTsPCn6_12040 [Croceitalea sp. MTPC6]GMN16983.1 hypothetical protein MTsPCn9_19190 [Croceitalea sp. MTPC9]
MSWNGEQKSIYLYKKMNKRISFLFLALFQLLFANCQNHGELKILADLPSNLEENSGIQFYPDNTIWVIEDNGNKDEIYGLNLKGKIVKEFKVKNAKNRDWEDLTRDINGNLYIGDFGNNGNDRKRMTIYKLPNPKKEPGEKIDAEKIEFVYPEQKKFPPKKEKLYYDTEAFFHWENALYIITKNRTRPYDGKALIYKVPDKKGNYEAELVGKFIVCKDQDKCSITSADISSNGKKIALLTYGYVLIITDFEFDDFSKGKKQQIELGARTQLEAVCFKNDSTLLISDEQSHAQGGNLYALDLSKF